MQIKLVDVPEMGYYAKDGKGEICARGPHLMEGYYGMSEETAKVLDEDGFVHTGDVGEWIKVPVAFEHFKVFIDNVQHSKDTP